MSFAASERTLEFYALTASNDTIDDFREGHDRAYDRGAQLNLVTEETARRLKQLYRDNRAAAYYRATVVAAQQATQCSTLRWQSTATSRRSRNALMSAGVGADHDRWKETSQYLRHHFAIAF